MGWMKRQLEESYPPRKAWSDYGAEIDETRPVVWIQIYYNVNHRQYVLEGKHGDKRFDTQRYKRLSTAVKNAGMVLAAADDVEVKRGKKA